MENRKDDFDPAFDFISGNSSILLHTKSAAIRIGNQTYSGKADMRMDLAPRANIYLYGYFNNVPESIPFKILFGQEKISLFNFDGHEIKGFHSGITGQCETREMNVKWHPSIEPLTGIVGNEFSQIRRVIFHLFNFQDIWNIQENRVSTSFYLNSDEWEITLDQTSQSQDNFKKMKSEGGCHLTHIGCIKRKDGMTFSGCIAADMLMMLRFFLSFSNGNWCEPICPVGFDQAGIRIWESWSSPRDYRHFSSSWFDPHHSSQLQELFPGFADKWKDMNWRETLRGIIYWYINANNGQPIATDAGIILTQAAIERLSYEYAVEAQRLVTDDGFKKLWASDEFRLLFSSLGIPLDIPEQTPMLKKLAKDKKINWIDAPHALTEVRNSLVHPAHKVRHKIEPICYEAWNLGLWYLELSILRICGYSGKYSNRLVNDKWVGTIEDVPWNV